MSNPEALILGLVQGLTEFLPVSSSGHLVLAGRILKISFTGLAFEIWLHLATLAAVLVALRRDIVAVLRSFIPRAAGDASHRRLGWSVVIGTLPAVVVGLTAGDLVEAAFTSVRWVGADLLLTALILLVAGRRREGDAQLTPGRALIIGVAQALAIFPGISRSGTTLAAGLMLGLPGVEAARFSFLLAIPAILGAVVLNAGVLAELGQSAPGLLVVGFLAAALSGYAAIRLVWRVMERGKLAWFAPYCAVVGILALVIGGTVAR